MMKSSSISGIGRSKRLSFKYPSDVHTLRIFSVWCVDSVSINVARESLLMKSLHALAAFFSEFL